MISMRILVFFGLIIITSCSNNVDECHDKNGKHFPDPLPQTQKDTIENHPYQKTSDEIISDFLIENSLTDYEVVIGLYEDLNIDSINDILLVLSHKDSIELEKNDYNRPFIIALGNLYQNHFRIAVKNDTLIIPAYEAGYFDDCLQEIEVIMGQICLKYWGAGAMGMTESRWSRTTCFLFDPKRNSWILNADQASEYFTSMYEDEEVREVNQELIGKISISEY